VITSAAPALAGLEAAWERSDRIFGLLAPGALLAQPIALRQPFVFYLGHLPAFSWNHLGGWLRGEAPLDERLDALFARGIDPVGEDAYVPARPEVWPPEAEVYAYRDRARDALRRAVAAVDPEEPRARLVLGTLLEHELMHQETLLYMLQQVPLEQLRRPADAPPCVFDGARVAGPIAVPAGRARLGRARGAAGFAWDNEYPEHEVDVPAFVIEGTPVRQRDLMAFVEAGGYGQRTLWDPEAWAWRERRSLTHPLSWRRGPDGWHCRTLFDELPLPRVLDWPASVSGAEAMAFARWRGARLPTEAELHRAAYGTPSGALRPHPWGDAPPSERHGNFGFTHWAPTPVGTHPAGASAWGVHDLMGDGWEWTSTPFAPLPGFEAMPNYPGYSADFFDQRHYVMLGASYATDARLVRRSFRNWFQPHYPYVFSKFRLVVG
jgi:ergothioneine biosynthesis protein EgtB